jgi:hypothetical protein
MMYDRDMRTTLDIDEDVLQAAKEIAAMRKSTAGKVLSELARKALEPREETPLVRHGVPILPARAGERHVSIDDVDRLLDDE